MLEINVMNGFAWAKYEHLTLYFEELPGLLYRCRPSRHCAQVLRKVSMWCTSGELDVLANFISKESRTTNLRDYHMCKRWTGGQNQCRGLALSIAHIRFKVLGRKDSHPWGNC